MGRNLDLDNCTNKQEAVLAAYVEELEENERKIVDEGAWAISLDMSRITFWYPDSDAILSRIILSRTTLNGSVSFTKGGKIWLISLPGDGTELSLPQANNARTASDSQKWHDINREKGEQQRRK